MTPYQTALAAKHQLETRLETASAALKPFPRNAIGLTPDDIKATPEWQTAKRNHEAAHMQLRNFNGWFIKTFKKEYRADTAARHTTRGPAA